MCERVLGEGGGVCVQAGHAGEGGMDRSCACAILSPFQQLIHVTLCMCCYVLMADFYWLI